VTFHQRNKQAAEAKNDSRVSTKIDELPQRFNPPETAVLLLKTYSPMPWLVRMASWKHLAARVLRLAKDRLS
jgi:hypothetical protein